MIKIETVADISQKTQRPEIHVTLVIAGARQQKQQEHTGEEEIEQRPLKCGADDACAGWNLSALADSERLCRVASHAYSSDAFSGLC